MKSHVLGIDIGTSGIRACIVNSKQVILYQNSLSMPVPNLQGQTSTQSPSVWKTCLDNLLDAIPCEHWKNIGHIIGDATSSTLFLASSSSKTLAMMYNDCSSTKEACLIEDAFNNAQQELNENSGFTGALGASSSLAKVMKLYQQMPNQQKLNQGSLFIFHQIDWLTHYMTGQNNITDENNALKLGYDSVNNKWPSWVKQLCPLPLPKVVKPGTVIKQLDQACFLNQLDHSVEYHAGTTDSIAAFLATGANKLGDAMTSLGSSIAIKMISEKPIFNAQLGVYSHRLNNYWLAGGASNAGGLALLKFFSLEQIKSLSKQPLSKETTGLNYVPLIKKGERFPIYNPDLMPCFTPIAKNEQQTFQAILEALTNIETKGYQHLVELSGTNLTRVFTTGGGAYNEAWTSLRKQNLPIKKATLNSAAFGVTRLVLG